MILKSIKFSHFRSYQEKEFKFSEGTSLVAGSNRSGKTNLLEAIYLLATGRSFRAGVEREMIRYGKELARISGVSTDGRSATLKHGTPMRASAIGGTEDTELEIILTTGQVAGKITAKKRYLMNGVGKRRMDFVGQLRCVLFGPEDLEIILGSPSIRRDYLDNILEQVDREYRRANLSYQKGLRQRNKLLEQIREEGKPRSILFFWNKLLVENGEIITKKRGELIDFINQQPDHFGKLSVKYDKSVISPQRLEKYADQELAAGMTLVGPHRDDFAISLMSTDRETDLHRFGSRGEQRTAVLSLKLAEMGFVTEKTGSRPVLLLDDIFSELDQEHRARIFEIIPKQQTIITTTDIRLVDLKQREKIEIIELE